MIHFIAFSRNRPLQLDGLLRSLKANVRGDAAVDVLVRPDDDYRDAYNEIQSEYDDVRFFDESDFARDMHKLMVIPSDFICFVCDDVLFQRPLDMDDAEHLLINDDIIGISLRLGRHVTHGMFWNAQPLPQFVPDGPFLTWDMNAASGDWCYPWDVLGTIYRYDFVQRMLPTVAGARNPSQFEDAGSRCWKSVTGQHRYACWTESRTTIPTPNVVQEEFGNGYVGQGELDAQFLLDCWKHGLRMDIRRYSGHYPTWRIADFHLTRRV